MGRSREALVTTVKRRCIETGAGPLTPPASGEKSRENPRTRAQGATVASCPLHVAVTRVSTRLGVTACFAALLLSLPVAARAGGFTIPDHGTQALGRGAAFVAKADDPTALYYNPSGLAGQRGTTLLVDANIIAHSYEFQRAGAYPDDPNSPATPWGGKLFPVVASEAGPSTVPFLAIASDFDTFDRLTFGFALYSPSVVGNRTFQGTVNGVPASSRYDFVQSRSLLLNPTVGAGYRITPWLDVGLTGALAIGKYDQTAVLYADAEAGYCPDAEYAPCDATSTLTASGTSFQAGLGATLRPTEDLQLGLVLKTPYTIRATGQLAFDSPRALGKVTSNSGAAELVTSYPLEARLGGRYISRDGNFEVYDLELDVTYEGWGAAQGQGPELVVPSVGAFENIDAVVVHGYHDTFGLRFGGAYNLELFEGVGSIRGGAYFDSSATDSAHTRLDADTLAKVAGTVGVGYRQGPVAFDLAYAAVASIPRVVEKGEIRPLDIAKSGPSELPAVNQGAYRGFTHILSLGVTVRLEPLVSLVRNIAAR